MSDGYSLRVRATLILNEVSVKGIPPPIGRDAKFDHIRFHFYLGGGAP
jgi:hypothetical protein